jgi:hypothetical protein
VVRVGTEKPSSRKNSCWPAGEQMQISRTPFVKEFRNWYGAFAHLLETLVLTWFENNLCWAPSLDGWQFWTERYWSEGN